MPTANDANLLFGVMAVQLKFVSPQALMEAAASWAVNQEVSLKDHLIRNGLLGEPVARMIGDLIQEQLKIHHGDEKAALQTFGGDKAVKESFAASSYLITRGESLASFGGVSREPEDRGSAAHQDAFLEDRDQLTIEHPDRYTISGEHSRGGIGRVLLAFDSHIGREIAVKELLAEGDEGEPSLDSAGRRARTAIARFLREARITGQLEHPSIVPVYELGKRPGGAVYYTMKLVRGRTMADAIREAKTFEDRLKLLTHFLDLTNAVSYAHSRQVIHRDLKPQNVMVGEFGETVVLDWGLAKIKGGKEGGADTLERELKLIRNAGPFETVQGSPLGTPAYMSPEQAEGRIDLVDERSDVWSMGAVLYEILTGRAPFEGDTAFDLMGKILTQQVLPVAEVEPRTPPELAAIVMKCLDKDPDRRYQNAEELSADVESHLTGRLVSAYQYSIYALFRRWLRKWWPVAATVAVALTALIAVFAWSFVKVRDQRNQALVNIATAYYAYGQWAQNDKRWGAAQVYFSQALAMNDDERTRYALNYAATASLAPARLQNVFAGHEAPITDLATSPDGARLASADARGVIRLWELPAGKSSAVLTGHQGPVHHLAWSADATILVSAGEDLTVRAWDAAPGRPRWTHAGKDIMRGVAVSPDGSAVAAVGDDPAVVLLNASDGKASKVLTGHRDRVYAATWSAGGSRLLTYSRDQTARVWDLQTGQALVLAGHDKPVSDAVFSRDGTMVLTGSVDETVRAWGLDDGREVWRASAPGPARWLVQSSDGKQLAVGSGAGQVQVLAIATGEKVSTRMGHRGQMFGMAGLPGSENFATCGGDQLVKLWKFGHPGAANLIQAQAADVTALAASPSGDLLLTGGVDKLIRAWEVDREPTVPRIAAFAPGIAASAADARTSLVALAGVKGGLKLLDVKTHQLTDLADGLTVEALDLALAEDGRILAAVDKQGRLRIWDLQQSRAIVSTDGAANLRVIMDPRALRAATLDAQGHARVYSLETGGLIHELGGEAELDPGRPAISPDGRLLAVAQASGAVKVWGLDGGALVLDLPGHQEGARAVRFSPGRQHLATGGKDNLIKIWDLATGKAVLTLEGHRQTIRLLAYSRDGRTLVSAGSDRLVISWDAGAGRELQRLLLSDNPAALAFRPDSGILAIGSRDEKIRLWDPRSGRVLHLIETRAGSMDNLAFQANSALVSVGSDGQVMVWPFLDRYFQETPDLIDQRIGRENGLQVKGMELEPLTSPAALE